LLAVAALLPAAFAPPLFSGSVLATEFASARFSVPALVSAEAASVLLSALALVSLESVLFEVAAKLFAPELVVESARALFFATASELALALASGTPNGSGRISFG
jgi:hypothetical protein